MKRRLILTLLFLGFFASADGQSPTGQYPQTQSSSDFTIKVHILETHFRQCAEAGPASICHGGVYVDAVMNGKKLELFGEADKGRARLILPGDHRARLPRKSHSGDSEVLFEKYELLLPDETAWACEITGFSE